MGLFSQALGALSGSSTNSAGPEASVQAILGLIHNPSVGGIAGLTGLFQNQGLGHVMQGWISNGPNPQVSAEQITQVLGSPRIAELAGKLGLSPEQAAQHISQLLPHIIDHMTPNGTAPTAPTSAEEIFSLLKSKL